MNFNYYLNLLKNGNTFSRVEAEQFLSQIIEDENITEEQIAEALTVLSKKDISADEVCGFIDAMKERMVSVSTPEGTIDTCGTGGDKSGTFNISTAAAILISAGGVNVAKHGNRAATSRCGSADVLEALGIPADLSRSQATDYLGGRGFVFLFAPLYHPALKRLAIVRKKLGFPTIFNILGPLLNPGRVKRQVIGTFNLENARLLAQVMARMDYDHGIVVTSADGLDEASLSGPVHIFEIKGSTIDEYSINASDFGLKNADISELKGGDATENAELLTDALNPRNELDARQRIIILNSALGFYVSGKVVSIKDGVELAKDTLLSGKAKAKLKELQAR